MSGGGGGGGAPRVRSMNVAVSEARPVLGPAGNNKARSGSAAVAVARKPASKPLRSKPERTEKTPPEVDVVPAPAVGEKKSVSSPSSPPLRSILVPSVLRKQDQLLLLQSNLSLDASCSSDASSDSLQSRSSAGKGSRSSSVDRRRKPCVSKAVTESLVPPSDVLQEKKRCAWVTANTEPCYAAFHDEEWGVPVHDDKKLFELLVLSGALAEHSWPAILIKRHTFREVFADFDPVAVSKLNEKKLIAAGGTASSLLSEQKLRAIVDNARQISKIVNEFGSFDKYIWNFVNKKPIVSKFRYSRQVPAKTAKAEFISKDLLRRGFRSVTPTIIYSFMQVAGMTNDHLVSCFRFQECIGASEKSHEDTSKTSIEERKAEDMIDLVLARAIDEFGISSE
ncbi:hypothetical protein Scep_008552 [Stephania cephalantha]|uniref:DNA-3-methyladenine glycosylase I n=1 Tax=Stephania cephalantha TaxID=152367 RepID=A0AAP0KD39_9MAGN